MYWAKVNGNGKGNGNSKTNGKNKNTTSRKYKKASLRLFAKIFIETYSKSSSGSNGNSKRGYGKY